MFDHIHSGEYYDATKEQNGWATSNFDDSKWQSVNSANAPGGVLTAQLADANNITETVKHYCYGEQFIRC